MNRRIAARAIIADGNKLFCVRQKHYTGRAVTEISDFWCTPGGGVDDREDLMRAIEREITEELGIQPIIGNFLYVQQFVHKDTEHIEFFFHVTNTDDFRDIDLSKASHGDAEIAEYGFITSDSIAPLPILPTFLQSVSLAEDIAAGRTKLFNFTES